MKRLVNLMLGGALVFGLMTSCSEEKKGYTLEGEVAGVQEGMVYLKKSVEKNFVLVDSAQVTNGAFKFEGIVDEPQAYGICIKKDARRPQVFFLDNESVTLKLNENENKLEVVGSPINDLYKQNASLLRNKDFSIDSLIMVHPASAVPAYFLANNLSYQFDLNQLKELRGKFDASLDGTAYIKQLESIIARLGGFLLATGISCRTAEIQSGLSDHKKETASQRCSKCHEITDSHGRAQPDAGSGIYSDDSCPCFF